MDRNINAEKDLAKQSEFSLGQLLLGLDGKALSKAILEANIPVKVIQSLPAQSLYMAIQASTIENSRELIAASTPEQYQLLLDFELWSGDNIKEDRFFNWIKIVDDQKSLQPLEKFLSQVDDRILAAMVGRYVDVQINQEPTDPPRDIQAYSPDKGYTWLSIHSESIDQNRIIGRILAYLFDTDPEYFYRLISSPKIATWSELEEESYQDRIRRLGDQGIPDHQTAWKINSPRTLSQALSELNLQKNDTPPPDNYSYPIPHPMEKLEPLSSLLAEITANNERDALAIESALTTLTNAGIVYYKIDFSNANAVKGLIKKIRGAINLGIELIKSANSDTSLLNVYSKLSLGGLYQLGLSELKKLKLYGESLKTSGSAQLLEPDVSLLLEAICGIFPEKPIFLDISQTTSTKLSTELKAIETLAEIQQIRCYLEDKIQAN